MANVRTKLLTYESHKDFCKQILALRFKPLGVLRCCNIHCNKKSDQLNTQTLKTQPKPGP